VWLAGGPLAFALLRACREEADSAPNAECQEACHPVLRRLRLPVGARQRRQVPDVSTFPTDPHACSASSQQGRRAGGVISDRPVSRRRDSEPYLARKSATECAPGPTNPSDTRLSIAPMGRTDVVVAGSRRGSRRFVRYRRPRRRCYPDVPVVPAVAAGGNRSGRRKPPLSRLAEPSC
jgi:hypothetical protein